MTPEDIAPPDSPSLGEFTDPPAGSSARTPAGTSDPKKRPSGYARKKAAEAKRAASARANLKETAAASDSSPKGPGRPSNDDKLRKSLVDLYVQTGVIVSVIGDTRDGTVIAENAATCADAWVELARVNPTVRRVLDGMLKGSAWGAVIMAHGPIVLAIMANHGTQVPGVPGPPDQPYAGPEGNGSRPV
jgi:hypothetical protein